MNVAWVIIMCVVFVLPASLAWRWVSARADTIRRYSAKDADTVEQLRLTTKIHGAVPFHDRSFDKPR